MLKPKRRFFTEHAKSSAMVVSVVVHLMLIVVAVSYVAVTVINKEDPNFDAKKVSRPKMQLKKLQIPVNIKKKSANKPKLRKRIVVQPRLNQQTPDIKMPEITGVKGGLDSVGNSGLGSAGSLGFTLPEINIFGLKSRGEKVFLILDCGPSMMVDERGGIPAYDIIKNELLSIVANLPSTTLFNISVYSKGNAYLLFPQMKSVSAGNVEQARAWLLPLNQFTSGMGDKDYGPQTLGAGGTKMNEELALPPLHNSSYWLTSALVAMKQQADSIYVLTQGWGNMHYVTERFEQPNWSEDKQKKFEEAVAKARRMFNEENKQRREKGLPPKVLPSMHAIVNTYVPGTKFPPGNKKRASYTPDEIKEGLNAVRQQHAGISSQAIRSGLVKKKDRFSFNVIHFTTKEDNETIEDFKILTDDLRGKYIRLEGLDAIRFKASTIPEEAAP